MSAVRRLSAEIVKVGLAVAPVGNVPLPTRNRFLVIPRTLRVVDDGILPVGAHAVGAHDMAGADVGKRNLLAVDLLVEPGRIAPVDRVNSLTPILRTADSSSGRPRRTLPRVVGDIVGDLRARKSETVGEVLGERHAIFRVRGSARPESRSGTGA